MKLLTLSCPWTNLRIIIFKIVFKLFTSKIHTLPSMLYLAFINTIELTNLLKCIWKTKPNNTSSFFQLGWWKNCLYGLKESALEACTINCYYSIPDLAPEKPELWWRKGWSVGEKRLDPSSSSSSNSRKITSIYDWRHSISSSVNFIKISAL